MRYGTVCSGIGAPEMAWESLGWACGFMSEIDAFPRAVLEHHYPDVPLHGDFTTIGEDDYGPVDLICGGTPCQAFSIAGLRGGLEDERGNLTLEFVRLVERKKPRWVVWENVPGVLSIDGGRAFGSFLGGLAQLGYGFAYRVLDAQYFGVPQRRRRVFVVAHLGSWQRAAAVLFEPESLCGDITPRRETGQGAAEDVGEGADKDSTPCISDRAAFNQGENALYEPKIEMDETCPSLVARGPHAVARMTAIGEYVEDDTASAMKARDYKDATDLVYSFPSDMSATQRGVQKDRTGALRTGGQAAVMYENHMQDSRVKEVDVCPSLSAKAGTGGGNLPLPQIDMSFRRLTPTECERLQGFPDDFTQISWKGKAPELCPDGPRYKALGNSMAVPVLKWIGERIQLIDDMEDA